MLDKSDDLIALAKSRQPRDRERLLMGVVALCERSGGPGVDERARTLIDQVFMALVVQTESDVRAKLAARIADAPWAPKALIDILALDGIEIARPIIAESPLLADTDLIRLMVEATLEHQIEVARRPNIDQNVVDAILDRSDPAALAALAHNETARIAPEGMTRLVDSSRRLPALRAPLSRHPKLTEALGLRLYAWVGDALRAALASRFQLDEKTLAAAIAQAVQDAKTQPPPQPAPAMIDTEQAAAQQSLVDKLDMAGQLKPGYLLRALREGKLSLFEAALARLGGLDAADMRRAANSDRPELLALACICAGVDRGVFSALLSRVRELNGERPGGGADGLARAMATFSLCPPEAAAENFRRIVATI
ncbi:MAG TPA: DUF2336 domain-containing protein [Caulobacteraceae bacterium]|nr:DUF2336 domain-containing protein [Caulobacteraceae bacterium]